MKRRTYLKAVGTAATACAGGTAVVSGQQGSTTHTVGMWTKNGNYYFDPIGLYVEPGDTVRWVNKSGAHSATSYSPGNPRASKRRIPKEAKPWNSGTLSGDAAYEYTFEVKGTYDYYCIPHKTLGMVGRIVCGEPGGIAAKKPIPDEAKPGQVPSSDVIVRKKEVPFPYTKGGPGGGAAVFRRAFALFGGIGAAAVVSYHALNSEGESSQVGSEEWRHETGLDRGEDR